MRRSTGWWGRPGDQTVKGFTKVHVADNGRPICGSRIGNDMKYQWCAWGAKFDYIECGRCKEIIRKELRKRYEHICQGHT